MQYLHSLKRNHYYKGKLLTAEDFIMEQNYHIQKLDLHNQLYYEDGIIYGLQLDNDQDDVIVVKAGAAQNGEGKLIIVSKNYYCKLEALQGFKKEMNQCMHLYLEYAEKHLDSNYQALLDDQNHQEYNVDKESYTIFADCQYDRKAIIAHFFQFETLYEDEQIMIEQQLPKLIADKGSFTLTVNVYNKKLNDKLNVGFLYLLDAPSLFQKDRKQIKIHAEECEVSSFQNCFKFTIFHKSEYMEKSATVDIRCNKIKVICNHVANEYKITSHQELAICHDIKKRILENVRECVPLSDNQIYLGSIYYEWVNAQFKILRVISVSEAEKQASCRIQAIYQKIMKEYGFANTQSEEAVDSTLSGTLDLDEFTLKEDGIYVSNWLKNPLGKGNAFLAVAVETHDKKQALLTFGTLVDEENMLLHIQYGMVLDAEKGQFKILLKLPRSVKHKTKYIHYYISKVKKVTNDIGVSHLKSLEPALITLLPRQTCRFIAVFDDAKYKSAVSFHALDGGEIYENGYYVAPSEEGVYHICAIDNEGNTADSYVCVKIEKGKDDDHC